MCVCLSDLQSTTLLDLIIQLLLIEKMFFSISKSEQCILRSYSVTFSARSSIVLIAMVKEHPCSLSSILF